MKKDFNIPTEDVIPHFTGLPCDCVDCVKNASYTKQLNDRNAVYVNSFDFPDFNDLKIKATEILGYATGNPVAISTAQTAASIKTAVKKEVAKVNSGGTTAWTNLPKDVSGKAIVPDIDVMKLAPKGSGIDVDLIGLLGPFKWVLILVIVAVVTGIFFRIKG